MFIWVPPLSDAALDSFLKLHLRIYHVRYDIWVALDIHPSRGFVGRFRLRVDLFIFTRHYVRLRRFPIYRPGVLLILVIMYSLFFSKYLDILAYLLIMSSQHQSLLAVVFFLFLHSGP